MGIHDIGMQIEEPLHALRTYINRAVYVMQDVMEDYFHMEVDTDNPNEWARIAYDFKRNAARAEVVEDALYHIQAAQHMLDTLEKQIGEQMYGGERKEGAA